MRKTIFAVLVLSAAVVSAEDSPMVALAKRSNRKASKAPLITNETIARSRGHVSLPAGTAVNAPAPLPATVDAATTPAAAPTPRAAATEPARTDALGRSYAPSSARNIAPESTARNITPTSSARTINPTTAAGNITPQTTAGRIDPRSTARTITPQSTAQTEIDARVKKQQ
ncbi:MAG TPA: hypothetical protein VND45_07970 [Thermoanaerobaculia bacterium]|nr:hypothetical protein [Thermoanaerobaculia bacterium]